MTMRDADENGSSDRTDAAEFPDSDAERPDAVSFDPTGLDLARTIAEAVAHTAPLPPPKRRERRERRRGASGRGGKGDPTPLGEALDGLIKAQGWSTEVSVHSLLARWEQLVGRAVAEHSRPEGFAAGVVTVRTDSTAWASQLRLMTPQLLAKINEALGHGTVTRIAVKGPDAPSWKHGLRSVRDGRGPRDTYG